MFDGLKEFFAGFFSDNGDVSGIKKTNSYYRNVKICEEINKREKKRKRNKNVK
jgi:hypothetical protein